MECKGLTSPGGTNGKAFKDGNVEGMGGEGLQLATPARRSLKLEARVSHVHGSGKVLAACIVRTLAVCDTGGWRHSLARYWQLEACTGTLRALQGWHCDCVCSCVAGLRRAPDTGGEPLRRPALLWHLLHVGSWRRLLAAAARCQWQACGLSARTGTLIPRAFMWWRIQNLAVWGGTGATGAAADMMEKGGCSMCRGWKHGNGGRGRGCMCQATIFF